MLASVTLWLGLFCWLGGAAVADVLQDERSITEAADVSELSAAGLGHGTSPAVGSTRVGRSLAESWLQLLAEYGKSAGNTGPIGEGRFWQPKLDVIDLPRAAGEKNEAPSLLVLTVPVPVLVPNNYKNECKEQRLKSKVYFKYTYEDDDEDRNGYDIEENGDYEQVPVKRPLRPLLPWRKQRPQVQALIPVQNALQFVSFAPHALPESPTSPPPAQPAPITFSPPTSAAVPPTPETTDSTTTTSEHEPAVSLEIADVTSPDYSLTLVKLFREQQPTAPHHPPLLFDGPVEPAVPAVTAAPSLATFSSFLNSFNTGSNWRRFGYGRPNYSSNKSASPPPPLRLDRALKLRAELTVNNSDYTETYTAWWNPKTGESRVDFFGGATSTFRSAAPDGNFYQLEVHIDNTDESPKRVCGLTLPQRPAVAATVGSCPGLPDPNLFSFKGYIETESRRAELWTHAVSGAEGELGAARGERLSFLHKLTVSREVDSSVVPLKYSVSVSSSVLGDDFDFYEHRYLEAVMPSTSELSRILSVPNVTSLCDRVDSLDPANPTHLARLDPLREYTLPHRDPRYNSEFERYNIKYNRKYRDATEDAVRKALLVQQQRFLLAANRMGASFEVAENYLSDRLEKETQVLLGVVPDTENIPAEVFPHNASEVELLEREVPAEFDWRKLGGVTHVRNQGLCSSCWAFAVTAAVEGALFARTNKSVPLSEQCLVDCAHEFGAKGCKPTWPNRAYDYIQYRGLPALAEYPPYNSSVHRCAQQSLSPVTRISAHVNVTKKSVPALQVAIKKYSPTVVLVDGQSRAFIAYQKGVLNDKRCASSRSVLNHALVAVGWGSRRGETHFILKNSWTEKWGEGGFVRVHAATNTCGVLNMPSYPKLEAQDVFNENLPK